MLIGLNYLIKGCWIFPREDCFAFTSDAVGLEQRQRRLTCSRYCPSRVPRSLAFSFEWTWIILVSTYPDCRIFHVTFRVVIEQLLRVPAIDQRLTLDVQFPGREDAYA